MMLFKKEHFATKADVLMAIHEINVFNDQELILEIDKKRYTYKSSKRFGKLLELYIKGLRNNASVFPKALLDQVDRNIETPKVLHL